jgi:ketosteroid isomerase-like protein
MSQGNVEMVNRAIEAVNQRDLEGYLSYCTEDMRLITPLTEIGGAYEGVDGIRRFFADLEDVSPDFRLAVDRIQGVGADRVLAFLRVTATGRASGLPAAAETPTGNVYDLVDGKIKRLRIFFDRQEALEAAGLSE